MCGYGMAPIGDDAAPLIWGGEKVVQGHETRLLHICYGWHNILNDPIVSYRTTGFEKAKPTWLVPTPTARERDNSPAG